MKLRCDLEGRKQVSASTTTTTTTTITTTATYHWPEESAATSSKHRTTQANTCRDEYLRCNISQKETCDASTWMHLIQSHWFRSALCDGASVKIIIAHNKPHLLTDVKVTECGHCNLLSAKGASCSIVTCANFMIRLASESRTSCWTGTLVVINLQTHREDTQVTDRHLMAWAHDQSAFSTRGNKKYVPGHNSIGALFRHSV